MNFFCFRPEAPFLGKFGRKSQNCQHYFLLWSKETVFFSYFYHEIIFSSAELFDCTVKFKFYLNILVFLNINTNHASKEQYLNWKWSVRLAISQVFYPLPVFFRILVTFFQPHFCRTSHNLICNKFAILKNINFTKILEVGKFSSYVTSLPTTFREW